MRYVTLLLLTCVGCGAGVSATGATNGRRSVLPLTTFKPRDSKPVDNNGVGVVAGIVTWDTARRYKDAMVVVHWLEGNDRMPTSRAGNVGRVGPTAERWGEIPILPMPTFMVGIANRTDHAVQITPQQLSLVDGRGGRYAPFTELGAIEGRVEDQLIGAYRGLLNAPAVRDGLHTKLGTLKLLTSPVEIAPGADWVGYVAFQVPALTPAEYAYFANRVGQLELQFTDERGSVQLGFDKVVSTLMVTCPDDEKATLERCAPGGAMPRPSPQGP